MEQIKLKDSIARAHQRHQQIKLDIAKNALRAWAEQACAELDQLVHEIDADYLGIQERYFALVPESRRHLPDNEQTDAERRAGMTAFNDYQKVDRKFDERLFELSKQLGWYSLTRELTDEEFEEIHKCYETEGKEA